MMFFFALRNVFRNKRRSLLTSISIFSGAVIVTFAIGFINGLSDNFFSNEVNYLTGNVMVTTTEYARQNIFMPVEDYITDSSDLADKISKVSGVESVEQRISFNLLMGNGDSTVTAVGTAADLMSKRLNLIKMIKSGFLADSGIYLADGLAMKLGAATGSSIILFTKTSEGGQNGIKVRVNGIFHSGIASFDNKYFYINLTDARKLLKLDGSATEIFVFSKKGVSDSEIEKKVEAVLPSGLTARSTAEQVGNLYNLLNAAKVIYYFIDLLILLLASFVVVNTMMMSVFERIREIGMLKSFGMSDWDIFLNFTIEGAIIGSTGGIAGAVIGYLLVLAVSFKGIDYSQAMKSVDMAVNYIIVPYVGWDVPVITIIMSVLISTASAMLPANYAGKLTPAEMLRMI